MFLAASKSFFTIVLFSIGVLLVAEEPWQVHRAQERTYFMNNNEVRNINLAASPILSPNGVLTVNIDERLYFKIENTLIKKKFKSIRQLSEPSGSNLIFSLLQDYDEESNSYSPATVYANYTNAGLRLDADLEVYNIEDENWIEIGKLRLLGNKSSDQIQLPMIVSSIRLSNFKILKDKRAR